MAKLQILCNISAGHVDIKVYSVRIHKLSSASIGRAICLSQVKVPCIDVDSCPIGKFTYWLCLEFTHLFYLGASHLRIVMELLAQSVTVHHISRHIKVKISHLLLLLVFYLILLIYKWALIWQVVALSCNIECIIVKLIWSEICLAFHQLQSFFWKLTRWSITFVRWWWFSRLHLEIFNFDLIIYCWDSCISRHSLYFFFTFYILNSRLTCSKWLTHVACWICLLQVTLL